MVLEKGLVSHCAPTLASIKTGSLFRLLHEPEESPEGQVAALDRQLSARGVRVTLLRRGRQGSAQSSWSAI